VVRSVDEVGFKVVGAVLEVVVELPGDADELVEQERVLGLSATSVVEAVYWIVLVVSFVKCRVH
jgi:hypothetical protein